MIDQHRGGIKMIDRHVEKTLDLGGVQIERNTRSAPARVIRFATSLAVIGTRPSSLRSCRA